MASTNQAETMTRRDTILAFVAFGTADTKLEATGTKVYGANHYRMTAAGRSWELFRITGMGRLPYWFAKSSAGDKLSFWRASDAKSYLRGLSAAHPKHAAIKPNTIYGR